MKEEQKEFFEIMNSFKKLNISAMLPDISHGDFGILKMIDFCDKACQGRKVRVSDIVHCKGIPAPAVSRSLRSLEQKGHILRTVDSQDRRNTYVELTESGRQLLLETETIMNDFADAVFGQMGEANMQELNACLQRFLDTAKKEAALRKYNRKG